MKKLGIFGTEGFAREVADIAHALGYKTLFIASDKAAVDALNRPGNAILESEIEEHPCHSYAIGVGNNTVRKKIANRYRGKVTFETLIHPSATFGTDQREKLESLNGVIVCAGVRFTNNITVGEFSIFNLNTTIGHDVDIGSFVNISPGANISGNVLVEDEAFIGTGAAINQGTRAAKLLIGRGTTIGAGAVAIKSCDPEAIYVGSPARRIR